MIFTIYIIFEYICFQNNSHAEGRILLYLPRRYRSMWLHRLRRMCGRCTGLNPSGSRRVRNRTTFPWFGIPMVRFGEFKGLNQSKVTRMNSVARTKAFSLPKRSPFFGCPGGDGYPP